jgi:hypothetical protein
LTTPSPVQKPARTLTPALLSALAALVVLAVVTVVVVATGDDEPDPPPASRGTSSSAASSSTESPSSGQAPSDPAPVVDEGLGVRYTYPMNGYDELDWAGPGDVSAGIVDIHSTVSYAACTYAAGSDVLFGLLTSDEVDLAQAAKIAAVDMSKSVWAGTGEATITDPTPASEKTTDHDVTGQLVEIESTRADGAADECGTTTAHIAAFAFENDDGEVVVMISSHRTDGDALKDAGAFADDVTATIQSIALT